LPPREIVVIGGSAGSIEPLNQIVSGLPPDFPGSVFVVVHISADSPTVLARILSRSGPLPAANPLDREEIQRGHIYVASPDHHLTIEDGRIRTLRGPRENRHRPAIDPLFRTAARAYGPKVAGVVLSGLLDDGAAGLYAIKQLGGVTIVQDPADAEWEAMPTHAVEYVMPDYVLTARHIAAVLVEIGKASQEGRETEVDMAKKDFAARESDSKNYKRKNHRRKSSAKTGSEQPDANENVAYPTEGEGVPSVFACPECHGVLWELKDGKIVRFRCRTGHSFGIESLGEELSQASEAALWAAVRALEEKAALHRRMAEQIKLEGGISSRLLDQSTADSANSRLIRDMIFAHNAELERGKRHSTTTAASEKKAKLESEENELKQNELRQNELKPKKTA
jgi:two-component system, chemotaxis family, protein-glutamate methylesterase/glutaminase